MIEFIAHYNTSKVNWQVRLRCWNFQEKSSPIKFRVTNNTQNWWHVDERFSDHSAWPKRVCNFFRIKFRVPISWRTDLYRTAAVLQSSLVLSRHSHRTSLFTWPAPSSDESVTGRSIRRSISALGPSMEYLLARNPFHFNCIPQSAKSSEWS